jgi:predicted DsbA family dithiol-disulfide isomerase
MEEIKARQRSREKEIKEGDMNASYFFAKANQRKMKKTVSCLETNGVMLTESKDMLEHALEFYKALFGKEDRYNIRLQESFWEEDENVTHEENLELEVDLSEEEIFVAIKGS